jgi:membrane-associated phospholipid phosphatase
MVVRPRPAEWLLAGYAAVIVVVALTRVPAQPAAAWVVLAHLLVLALLALLQHRGARRAGGLLRDLAPIGLLVGLYAALDTLNGFGARPVHDGLVQSWERLLFGMQPSVEWWRRAPSPGWSATLHASYFAYYLIVPFPVAWFALEGRPALARRGAFMIMAAFCACYLAFLAFPVAGPYYEFPRPDPWFVANLPARTVYGMLETGSSYGAAFPSSHVAGTWAAVAATYAGSRRWGLVLAVPASLLTVGVVYCQMHYAVDALAGVGVAAVAVGLSGLLPGKA